MRFDRPVVDDTGLQGGFDYTMGWAPEGQGPDAPAGAQKDELGLKLVPKRAPVEVILVDKVERPTAN